MTVKRMALIESVINVGSGFLIGAFVIQPIVFAIYNIQTNAWENLGMAVLFTVASIIRSYLWRIFFHNRFYKNKGLT